MDQAVGVHQRGVLAGLGGILMTARLDVAAPTAATGYGLDIIAAAVIGGVSLFGGEGTTLYDLAQLTASTIEKPLA